MKRNFSLLYSQPITLLAFMLVFAKGVFSQITATTSNTPNTQCNSDGCSNYTYSGPRLVLNEIMMSPSTYDGSIYSSSCGGASTGNGCGEWIELYNPNLCQPIDVSCFKLGNNTTQASSGYSGGFTIPPGTVVPPGGFLIIRGINAPAVNAPLLVSNGGSTIEIIADVSNSCFGGPSGANRFWLPNYSGWLGLYDNNGIPLDALCWGPNPQSTSDVVNYPCVVSSTGCSFNGLLASFNQIPSSNKSTLFGAVPDFWGYSKQRVPDGGSWLVPELTPTMGSCNSMCNVLPAGNCTGTATISPIGGATPYTFLWNDSQAQTTATATGLCAGSYTVTVTDNNGDSEQFTVIVSDFVPTINVNSATICAGESAMLTASGASSYTWSPATGLSSTTSVSVTANPAVTTTYTVTGTTAEGCTGTATSTVTVGSSSTITVNSAAICTGESTTLTASGGSSYTWSPATGLSSTTGASVTANPTVTTTYTVTSGSGTCLATAISTVTVNPIPTISVNSEVICLGQNTTLTAVPSVSGGSFSWTPGGQSTAAITVEPASTSNYTVTYTLNGCSASVTGTITVNNGVNATISATNTVIDAGETVLLTAGNADSYLWSSGETTQTISVSPMESTTYCVTVNEGGCTDSTCIDVSIGCESVVYAPNCITANGDQINDVFIVQTYCLIEYHLFIVNRWGELIFETWDINDYWDGTYKGKPVCDGVYTYVIVARGSDNKFYDLQGFVTVLR